MVAAAQHYLLCLVAIKFKTLAITSDYDAVEESEDEDLPLLMTSHDIIQPLLRHLLQRHIATKNTIKSRF